MSALVPREAVTLLYRRYLKAAYLVSNPTLRMLLLAQIRSGFKRNRYLTSPSLQHELVQQAHKDLAILEDARLSRALFINHMGQVSCLDWEVRRVEYHFNPALYQVALALCAVFSCFVLLVYMTTYPIEQAYPEIVRVVDEMMMRLEAATPEEQQRIREVQVMQSLQRREQRDALERRILATFYGAPPAHTHAA